MDENIIPPTLDFEKPAAYAFVRHGMIRYKHATGKNSYFAIALEEPLIDVQAPAQPGKMESFIPDLTARYRYTNHWEEDLPPHPAFIHYIGTYRYDRGSYVASTRRAIAQLQAARAE